MYKSMLCIAVCSATMAGCASTGGSSMSSAELSDCLQPNRRVVVEVGGMRPPPAPKPGAKPEAKPGKPAPALVKTMVQGNSAFDVGSAQLKDGGKSELDKMVAGLQKTSTKVSSVVISGYVDRLEAGKGATELDEQRAQAVKNYLVSKGIDEKLIFWEGRDAKDPVPVTKFCE